MKRISPIANAPDLPNDFANLIFVIIASTTEKAIITAQTTDSTVTSLIIEDAIPDTSPNPRLTQNHRGSQTIL